MFQAGGRLLLVREGDTLEPRGARLLALGVDGVALELPRPDGAPVEYRIAVGEAVNLPEPRPAPARVQRLRVTEGVRDNED